MKKVLFFLLTVLVVAVTIVAPPALANNSSDSTSMKEMKERLDKENPDYFKKKKIIDRFEQIDEKYEIGEELSAADAAFIKKYANKAPEEGEIQAYGSKSIFGTDVNGPHYGNTSGTISNSSGVTWGSFSGNFTTTENSVDKPSRITNSLTHTAYGYVGGKPGVFKIYEKTKENTCYGTDVCNFNDGERFSGAVAYQTTIAKANVYYSNGYNLAIYPN